MSNHRFIQVDPPKEELILPVDINDFSYIRDMKTETVLTLIFTSTVATFTGIAPGDFIQLSIVHKETLIEKFLSTFEIATVTSVNEVETIPYDIDSAKNRKLTINNLDGFINPDYVISKVYKLPTNSFSLQVKTDSIIRYYEDPVDKTIMYLDVVDSDSICGHGTGGCTEVWEHDRDNLGIVTLNDTNRTPMHNIVPYLNSIFIDS